MYREVTWKTSLFCRLSGNGNSIFRSSLPGRISAGSRVSARFVAIMTLTLTVWSNPSICNRTQTETIQSTKCNMTSEKCNWQANMNAIHGRYYVHKISNDEMYLFIPTASFFKLIDGMMSKFLATQASFFHQNMVNTLDNKSWHFQNIHF